ncbi:MAG: cobalamin-binding protein [Planctomycetes bacterium]|nr:cobalamin-binding protein [Planctomycetota bacterium]
MRIASLLPSATEILCALGLEDALVGISHECDFPPSVAGRPVLTRTKVGHSWSSRTLDRDVRALLRDALAVYDIDIERLREVAPDVVVTQDLCDVCAVSYDDVCRAVAELARPDTRIVNLHPTRLADVWNDIRRVGATTGRAIEAERVVRDIEERLAGLARRAAQGATRPNVLTIEWLEPVMVGGTWMPELVAIAGGRALVTEPGAHAPTLSRADLARLDPAPDVVLVKPCGFALDRTRAELPLLRELLAGLSWPAVRDRRVWIADGNAYFNRPGPRLVDSAEILAACVHPAGFADLAARHAGGFERLDLRA